jgi:excisionase family DNA binding protein
MSEYETSEQVQERLKVSHDTINRMINRGDIMAVKIGRCVRIEMQSVEKYLSAPKMSESKQPDTEV